MRGDEPEIVELLRFPVLFEKWVRFLAGIWNYSIFHVIFGCGAAMMLLLIVGFSTLNRYGWKNIMLVLPCLSLTAGTALLLTGCESRFFYLTSL